MFLRGGRGGNLPLRSHPYSLASLDLNTSFLGHFMGKKSLELAGPAPLGTVSPASPRGQRLQLSHDLLGVLLLQKALGMSLSGPAAQAQVSHALPSTGASRAQPVGGTITQCWTYSLVMAVEPRSSLQSGAQRGGHCNKEADPPSRQPCTSPCPSFT